MPTLSANTNVTLSLTDYDSVTITCRGPVLVEAVSGLGVTGKIAEFAGTKTFGPFSPAGSLKLTAYGNDAQYEVADGVAPSSGGGGGGTTAVATATTLGLVKGAGIAADGTLSQYSQMQAKNAALQTQGLAHQAASLAAAQAGYTDSAATVIAESFANLTAWAVGATPQQVSGGRAYANSGAGTSGMNRSFALAASDTMRAVIPVTIAVGASSGGVMLGFNQDAAGAAPTINCGNCFGIYFDFGASATKFLNITASQQAMPSTQQAIVRGDYIATLTADPINLSVHLTKTDGTKEYYISRPRAGFTVNNITIFNSDGLFLSGSSVGPMSARKSMQTITPRTFGEGVVSTAELSGNLSATAGYMIWLPTNYDSRKPAALAILFHGDGTNHTAFVDDPTYPQLRKAMVAAGYICLSVGYLANNRTWGATVSTDLYYEGYKFVRDNYAIGPVVMLGCSMGGIESLNALAAQKIPGVVAWMGYSPTTNLAQAYATSWSGPINTAYAISGGNTYAIATAGYDPLLNDAHAFQDVPMLFAAATDDSVIPKALNTDLLAAKVAGISREVVVIAGITGGHGYNPSGILSQITSFADKYAK